MNKEKEMKNGVVDRISKNKKQLIGKEISKGGTSKNSKGKIGMYSFLVPPRYCRQPVLIQSFLTNNTG